MYEEFHCCMLSRVTRGSQSELSLINIQIDVECIIKKKLIPRFVRLFQMIDNVILKRLIRLVYDR